MPSLAIRRGTQEANAQKKEAAEKVCRASKTYGTGPDEQASASGELRVVGGQQEPLAIRSIYSVPCRRTLC